MRPFVLRRLKSEVLGDLPAKTDEVKRCALTEKQRNMYDKLVAEFSAETAEVMNENRTGMMMQLRKLANHPLLVRNYYDEKKLKVYSLMRKILFYLSNEVLIYYLMHNAGYSK